jgi:hypothetical protein
VFDEPLDEQLVPGELLHGLDEEVVERELALVVARHRVEEAREGGPRRRRRFDGLARAPQVVDERHVRVHHRRLRQLRHAQSHSLAKPTRWPLAARSTYFVMEQWEMFFGWY